MSIRWSLRQNTEGVQRCLPPHKPPYILPFDIFPLFLPIYKIPSMILRYFTLFSAIICLLACKEQPKTPPTAVGQPIVPMQEDFAKRCPNAQDVVWDTLDVGFSALFTDDEIEKKAFYDAKGVYQYTATFIEQESLPKAIQQVLDKKYQNAAAVSLQIDSQKGRTYQIELETSTDYINLEFDESGKLLKEEKHPLSNEEIQRQEEEGVDQNHK
ncbi:MAG: PepSY-like domain-containing protein [Saprospiraceae bacterium]|nr:PepSY-like domain-containing protein [Saprospiraceae bacterium]